MRKKTFFSMQTVLAVYLACYLVSSLCQSDFWGNILSPVGGLAAASILFYSYKNQNILFGHLLGAACACWAAADALWAVFYFFLHDDPGRMGFFNFAYLPAGAFLATAFAVQMLQRHKSWNTMQLIADITAVSGTGLILIWVILFRNAFGRVLSLEPASLSIFLSLLFDTFTVAFLLAGAASHPKKLSPSGKLLVAGALLFTAVDAYCAYTVYFGYYRPNSMTDFAYMLSLIVIAESALLEARNPSASAVPRKTEEWNAEHPRFRHKAILLLFAPALLIVLNRYGSLEILLLLVIAIAYELVTGFIQKETLHEKTLAEEQKLNALLRSRFEERTVELEEANGWLDYLTRQDVVTNLYNRSYFMDELDKMIQNTKNGTVALFMLDLDRFKAINDAYGHEVGDQVLIEIGQRLSTINHNRGILARLGGDEFVLACKGKYGPRETAELARKIVDCCAEPIMVEPYPLLVQTSVGISIYPADADKASVLLKNADMAMYHAKQQGGNRHAFF